MNWVGVEIERYVDKERNDVFTQKVQRQAVEDIVDTLVVYLGLTGFNKDMENCGISTYGKMKHLKYGQRKRF